MQAGAQSETTGQRAPLAPFAVASAFSCAVAFALAARAADKRSALFGAAAATLAAGCALPALALGVPRGTNGVLAGFAIGFLARIALVAIGLFAAGARGDAALAYALSFFGLYAATQVVEVAYVWFSSRRAGV